MGKSRKRTKTKEVIKTKEDLETGIVLPHGKTVRAHITGTPKSKKGTLSVAWQLWCRGRCLECASTPKTHKYDPAKESWDTAIRLMVAKAEDAFRSEYIDVTAAEADEKGAEQLFTAALNSLSQEDLAMLRKPTAPGGAICRHCVVFVACWMHSMVITPSSRLN